MRAVRLTRLLHAMERGRRVCLVVHLCVAAGCAAHAPADGPRLPRNATFALAGEFSIPPRTPFRLPDGPLFGGISGLAPEAGNHEYYGISDDSENSRVYRLRVDGEGAALKVTPLETIRLEPPPSSPIRLDPESVVLTRSGELIITSEGIGREPRVPPGLIRYTQTGKYVGLLDVRERYMPTVTGPLARGVRPNFGFEALTLSPDGERLFTCTETALVQDGDVATFDHGTVSRLLEYTADRASFRPAREFIYPLDPVDRPSFEASVVVKGLVELLALSRTEMLALERTYVENKATPGRGQNYARLYRIVIDGAADVSALESLKETRGLVPVRKTLVLDLAAVKGLGRELSPELDNFEALAFGPRLADGSLSLLIASDDNFNPSQRTWFLLFRVAPSR